MSYGFLSQSSSDVIQIDQDFVCVHEIMSGFISSPGGKLFGSSSVYYAEIDITTAPQLSAGWECVVFLKPAQLGRWVGGTMISGGEGQTYPHLSAVGEGPFYFKVFHVSGTPNLYADTHGIEIFKADGSLCYSSKRRYPAVFMNLSARLPVRSIVGASNHATSFSITDIGSIPWVLGNTLYYTPADESQYVRCARFTSNSMMDLANLDFTTDTFSFYGSIDDAYIDVTTSLARIPV